MTQKQINLAFKRLEEVEEKNRMLEESHTKLLDQLPLQENIIGNIQLFHMLKDVKMEERVTDIKDLKVLIFCEGKTDVAYIEKALELFGHKELIDAKVCRYEICGNDIEVRKKKNQKLIEKRDTYLKAFQEGNTRLTIPCIFVLDCDTNESYEVENELITFPWTKQSKDRGYIVGGGIENNFHQDVFMKLFESGAQYLKIMKLIENSSDGLKETIIEFIFHEQKVNICKWICEHGTKEDFIHFSPLVSLITELVGKTTTVS